MGLTSVIFMYRMSLTNIDLTDDMEIWAIEY